MFVSNNILELAADFHVAIVHTICSTIFGMSPSGIVTAYPTNSEAGDFSLLLTSSGERCVPRDRRCFGNFDMPPAGVESFVGTS
jgi:hypothetical protein